PPAGDVHLVDTLVADIAVPVVPVPVPLVVEAVLVERPRGRGAEPEVIVHSRRDRAVRLLADRGALLVAEAASDLDLPQLASADVFEPFPEPWSRAGLGTVLDDPVVLPRGLDDLPALPERVAERLLHVDVLARLDGPDGLEGVPLVGRGDGHRVDRPVLEEQTEVLEVPRPLPGLLLQELQGLADDPLIDVADR